MATQAVPQESRGATWSRTLLRRLAAVPPIYPILVVLFAWIIYENPNFTDPPVFLAFLRRASPLLILAAGQLFVIATGGYDLSVGSLITLTVLGAALMIDGDPSNTYWVIGALYLIGIAVGVFNGLVVSFLRVSSFITTLGMLLTLRGAALLWSDGAPAGYLPDNFRVFGRRFIDDVPVLGQLPYAARRVGALATFCFAERTSKTGKALGDNPRSARLSSVSVPKVRILTFVFSSIAEVTAGILLGGFAGVSMDVGTGYEKRTISTVLGGAVLGDGRGSIVSAMAGALSAGAVHAARCWACPARITPLFRA